MAVISMVWQKNIRHFFPSKSEKLWLRLYPSTSSFYGSFHSMISKLTIDLYLHIESYSFTCQLLNRPIFLDKTWKFWTYSFYWMPPILENYLGTTFLENYLGTTFLENSLILRNTSQELPCTKKRKKKTFQGTKNNKRYKMNQL